MSERNPVNYYFAVDLDEQPAPLTTVKLIGCISILDYLTRMANAQSKYSDVLECEWQLFLFCVRNNLQRKA